MARRKRAEGTRAPNGASTIYYSEYDQKWHGRVTVGVKDDGSPDRRHIERKTETEVIEEVRKLENERESEQVRKIGKAQTVEQWLTHWLDNIARPAVKYKAYQAYRTAVHHHLIPGLGKHRIDKVEPEHFEKLYAKILERGRKPATAHQVHRTARTAFGEAHRRQHIKRNPVALAKPPRVEEGEIEPFEIDDIRRLIKTALGKRNGVRFVLALAIGTRQGETIGLKWSRLNDKTRTLTISRQLQRRTWEHGCDDPHACSAKYHKARPCREGCKRHKRACPPPCPPNCVDHARWCPARRGGGLVDAEVKSRAGRRGIVLPIELYELLALHRTEQDREREHAGTEWHEGGWMFAQPTGRPVDPRRDLADWKALLTEAGVRDARLHDARHTAATVLLLLGVPERAVMDFMGWSNSAMAKRYQHVTAVLRDDIAKRLSGFLWQESRLVTTDRCPTCGRGDGGIARR
jgi:integrase